MDILLNFIPLAIIVMVIIEIKHRPRIDVVDNGGYYDVLLYYSIRDRFNNEFISREYIRLFQI